MANKLVIFFIRIYQYCLSPLLGERCRFYPSCSSYAILSLQRYSLISALFLILRRLGRCHPLNDGGYDPLPERK
ncbi:MAG: membrane protein insertion efficiency factor YidD [Pseudomonadota bacterium]